MVACGSRNDGLILQNRSRVAKQDTVCFEDLVSGEREMEEHERQHKSTELWKAKFSFKKLNLVHNMMLEPRVLQAL